MIGKTEPILGGAQNEAMKKSNRVEAWVAKTGLVSRGGLDPFYLAYFECFNKGLYYEAHDVLEQLWLREKKKVGENADFFKGLIQMAGAFVHLRKQYERPWHPKDGKRLRPAARLLRLAQENLAPFARAARLHESLDVEQVCHFCNKWRETLEAGAFGKNPWSPGTLPRLTLEEKA